MDVMQRRRQLMAMQGESELYPVGTNLYEGVIFQPGYIDNTGDYVAGNRFAVSDYLPVSTDYQYTRSYRLYGVYNYDEGYNFLGYQDGVNNLSESVIGSFLPGTKYIRTTVLTKYMNSKTGLIDMLQCWLKRTA